jgi:hypothetical protein
MLIHTTVSNRHDFGPGKASLLLFPTIPAQSPFKGFNQVLNVLDVLHYFTAFLHFCAVHSKSARQKVFILELQTAILILILASSYDLPVLYYTEMVFPLRNGTLRKVY